MIRFENVSFSYKDNEVILKNLNFEINKGDFYFVTGQSGAGKSTLLRMLFMSLVATKGKVSIFEQDVAQLHKEDVAHLRRRIGIVFQDFRLLDNLSIFQNIALPLRVLGQRAEDYQVDVIELLEWVELGKHLNNYPPFLSGGEQQRAAIARAVVAQPDLLIADEPTGNVDPELAQRLLRLFIELNKLGTTVIIATHDISLMREFHVPRLTLQNGYLTEGGYF